MSYPEHDKLTAVKHESQAIGEFLDTSGYTLCENVNGDLWPVQRPINTLLAEYFGIDLKKLEAEKRAMLDRVRATNPPKP